MGRTQLAIGHITLIMVMHISLVYLHYLLSYMVELMDENVLVRQSMMFSSGSVELLMWNAEE